MNSLEGQPRPGLNRMETCLHLIRDGKIEGAGTLRFVKQHEETGQKGRMTGSSEKPCDLQVESLFFLDDRNELESSFDDLLSLAKTGKLAIFDTAKKTMHVVKEHRENWHTTDHRGMPMRLNFVDINGEIEDDDVDIDDFDDDLPPFIPRPYERLEAVTQHITSKAETETEHVQDKENIDKEEKDQETLLDVIITAQKGDSEIAEKFIMGWEGRKEFSNLKDRNAAEIRRHKKAVVEEDIERHDRTEAVEGQKEERKTERFHKENKLRQVFEDHKGHKDI